MSGFTKPSTPPKNRANIKHTTPTKYKSFSSISSSSSNVKSGTTTKVLEEINLLLHLEALKRHRDNEIILRQRLEEAYKLFEERRYKYFTLVAKYVTLVNLSGTRKVFQRNDLNDLPTDLYCRDVKNIIEKLSSGSATDYICTTDLEKFKQLLHDVEKYKNLPIKRSELVDLQNATDAIQYSIEAIEISLEKCTTQGLDQFTDSLDMMNYPKLLNEYKQN